MAVETVLSAVAFTTVEKVKQQGSGIPQDDPSQDDAIRFLINAFSDLAMRYSGREFITRTNGSTTRTFPVAPIQLYGQTAAYIDFGRWDAQTITSVVVNAQTNSPLTLDTTQYQPVPIEQWDGVYTGINITGYVVIAGSLPGITTTAQVTGTWGWPTVPDVLLRDCVETVKTWLRMGYQVISGESVSGELGAQSQLFPADLPNTVKTHLDAFKNVTVFC